MMPPREIGGAIEGDKIMFAERIVLSLYQAIGIQL